MNEQKFRKRLNFRIFGSSFVIILGILILIFCLKDFQTFASVYQIGLGIGLIIAGIAALITTIRTIKNAEIFKKVFITETDERTIAIMKNASGFTVYISFIAFAVAAFISGYYNDMATKVFSLCAIFIMVVYILARIITGNRE